MTTRILGRTGADVTILSYGAMELRDRPHGPEIEPLPILASSEEAKAGPGPVIREASGVHAKPLEPLPSPSGVHRLPPQPA